MTAFGPISIDMYLPGLPAIGRALHASSSQVQWTVAAFFIGIAGGQLVYGPLSDRFGRRWPLLIGIALYIAASLGCALATSIGALIGLRIVQALGGCAGMVIARAIVRDRFQHHEVLHVFSMLMLVMGLAPILAPFAGGFMLQVVNWRWLFGMQAGFAALVGLAVIVTLPESRSASEAMQARGENPLATYRLLVTNRRLIGYVLTGAFSGAALFTYVATSPDIIISHFHIAPRDFGWVFGINAFGFIGCSQINARLARRVRSDVILKWANLGALLAGVLLLAGAVTGAFGIWGFLVPQFLIMSSMGFTQPNAGAGALGEDGTRAGAVSALVGAVGFIAGAGSSALAGALHDGTPRPMAFVVVGSLLLAVACLRGLVKPSKA